MVNFCAPKVQKSDQVLQANQTRPRERTSISLWQHCTGSVVSFRRWLHYFYLISDPGVVFLCCCLSMWVSDGRSAQTNGVNDSLGSPIVSADKGGGSSASERGVWTVSDDPQQQNTWQTESGMNEETIKKNNYLSKVQVKFELSIVC